MCLTKNMKIFICVAVVLLCIAAAVLFSVIANNPKTKVVYANDSGLIVGKSSAAARNTMLLQLLFEKTAKYKSCEIIFAEGTYYFDTSDGGLSCSNAENISLVGDNTLFVNTSFDNTTADGYFSTCLLMLDNVKNIKIKNISFDYMDYTSVNGEIVEATEEGIKVKLDAAFFTDGYHNAITGGELVYAANEISIDGKYLGDYYLSSAGMLTVDKDNSIVVLRNFPNNMAVGNTAVLRFGMSGKIPGFMVSNTSGFYIENVNVYSSPTAVIYSPHGSSDFELNGFNIIPSEQTKMLYSSNVDGVHLKNFSGKVTLKNCSFKGMGDDAFNTNSRAARVTAVNGNKVNVESGYAPELGMPEKWAEAGDVLNVYNTDWECLGQITVKSYTDGCITAEGDVSDSFINCYLENTRFSPEILIENTTVDLSRARAFMLRSKNVTVKNCTVKNTALSAIIASPDISNWYEMSPSGNVLITDCVFENCATAAYASAGGIITFKYADDSLREFATKIHKDVIIKNNTFIEHKLHAVYAMGIDGLTIENNSYESEELSEITVNCSIRE